MRASSRKNWRVLIGVAAPLAIFCTIYLKNYGLDRESTTGLLRLTARLAFLFYLLVFIARPLRQLMRNTATRWLLKERRSLGLAFAAVHLVHAAVIIFVGNATEFIPLDIPRQIVGGGVYALIVMMVVTSFDGPTRAIGPKAWRRLHKTGLYVIGFAFLQTLIPATLEELFDIERLCVLVLTAVAIFIRIAAFFQARWQKRSSEADRLATS